MRPGALLLNTSRGPIVDEGALISALREQRIFAALDVYDLGPLPVGHPFTLFENVVIAPHLGYASEANMATMFAGAVENIAEYLKGSPVRVI